jgi:hypothetical protein
MSPTLTNDVKPERAPERNLKAWSALQEGSEAAGTRIETPQSVGGAASIIRQLWSERGQQDEENVRDPYASQPPSPQGIGRGPKSCELQLLTILGQKVWNCKHEWDNRQGKF